MFKSNGNNILYDTFLIRSFYSLILTILLSHFIHNRKYNIIKKNVIHRFLLLTLDTNFIKLLKIIKRKTYISWSAIMFGFFFTLKYKMVTISGVFKCRHYRHVPTAANF